MEKLKSTLITCTPLLWTNTTTKEGKHPVKIRATYNRKSKYYNVQVNLNGKREKLYLTASEWEKVNQEKPRGDNREKKLWIQKAVNDAYSAYETATLNNRPFSFERFKAEYLTKDDDKGILQLFEKNLRSLYNDNQISTYQTYLYAFKAFKRFRNGKEISPVDLTPGVLKEFEKFLLTPILHKKRKKLKAVNKTTISIYMRALKRIVNMAIDKNPSLKEYYPFSQRKGEKNRYTIRTGSGKKGDALTLGELQTLIKSETVPGTSLHEAKLFWLFSFYCQGMNFKDIAYLRYRNIKTDYLEYVRSKTESTEKNEQTLQVPLTESIVNIIQEMGNSDKRPSSYVFSILNDGMDLEKQNSTIKHKIKIVNKWLKRLCENNKLPVITTYWARHTFASMLKDLNEPVEMIRELLGHADIRTTETYLKRFDLERKREVSNKISSALKLMEEQKAIKEA